MLTLAHQPKPIQTEYNGVKFRSRLEARWALFFDGIGVRWAYEPEGYTLPSGAYVPDFKLLELKTWIEIKPNEAAADERDRALCQELAEATGERVVLFGGIPGFWLSIDGRRADDECGIAWLPQRGPDAEVFADEDREFLPCICTDCGAFGIEYGGRAERVTHRRECTPWGQERHYGAEHPRIKIAADKANAQRFWEPKT